MRSWVGDRAAFRLGRAVGRFTADLALFEGHDDGMLGRMVEFASQFGEVRESRAGPSYVFESQVGAGGEVVDVLSAGVPFHPGLASWEDGLAAFAPVFGVVRDGAVVSVCGSSRSTKQAAEAGVETAEEYRGQGLARNVVAAWGNAVHTSGRTAFYSTSWENVASQAVAASLGLRMFGEGAWVR